MPVSYSKWDNIEDSDDEDTTPSTAKPSVPERDPAMDNFLKLGRDASVAQIQDAIAGGSVAGTMLVGMVI